jgi:putative copper resistance protein D
MAEALEAIRFVHFATAMAAFGIGAFRIYALAADITAAQSPASAELDRRLALATTAAAALALVTAAALVPFIAAEMAGAASAALDPATLKAVLFSTAFGHAWVWHIGFAVALLVLCAMPPRRWQTGAATTAALLLLVSLGWVGHAAEGTGALKAAHQANQMLHLTAAGLWVGGLVPLGILLGCAVRPGGGAFIPLARIAVPHFSQMGYVAVALVALTGTVNSLFMVGSFDALTATPYGRLLLVKIALFTAMVGLALVNRFRLVPRLNDAETAVVPLRALFRSVIVEQVLGLAILGVVAVLGTWPPAVHQIMAM